ncbi:MAG: NAD-dependent deacetylase [Planctomycetaceae bacterium]
MNSEHWKQAVAALREAKRVVVFTGAGISAESHIPTFRDDGGFWDRFPPEKFANWSGLLDVATEDPRHLADFLIEFIEPIAKAEPNDAHRAVVALERIKDVSIVTQNVDGLHQSAGSLIVREIHGTILETVETVSGHFRRQLTRRDLQKVVRRLKKARKGRFALPRLIIAVRPLIGPRLSGVYRPNLVLFGDQLSEPAWEQSEEAAHACDVFLSVGTSQTVMPAAGLPVRASMSGSQVFTIDPIEPPTGIWLEGKAADVLPKLVAEVTAS